MEQVLPSTAFSSVRCIGLQGDASQTAAASMCSQWQIVVLYRRGCPSDGCLKLLKWNKSSEANMTLNYIVCVKRQWRFRLLAMSAVSPTPSPEDNCRHTFHTESLLCTACQSRAHLVRNWCDRRHLTLQTVWYMNPTNTVWTDATWCGSALIWWNITHA